MLTLFKNYFATSKIIIKNRLPFLLILIPYVVWSLYTYQDFGISIDEPIEYGFGEMLYNRNFGRDPLLIKDFAHEGKDSREIWAYNHFHAMLLYIFNDSGSIENYHLLNLLFFSFGLYVAYEIALQFSKNGYLSLVAPLTLIFTPRLFGDVPTNVKDPVFATYYLFGLLAIIVSPQIKNRFLRTTFLGLSFGLSAAMRILGYSLLVVYFVSVYLENLYENKKIDIKSFLKNSFDLLAIFGFALLMHAIQMPFIASSPIKNLARLISLAKQYPWSGEMLYLGDIIRAGNLPWHYPVIWSGIVTPLFVLCFGLFGLLQYFSNKIIRVLSLALIINYVLYYLIKPNIYDGIRHLLFTLAILSLLAVLTWIKLWMANKKNRAWLSIALFANVVLVIVQYIQLHPYQYVYFNEIVGYLPGAYEKFETDYWGTSYREASMWLVNEHGDKDKTVALCGNPHAKIYFEGSKLHTIWRPDCELGDQEKVDYVLSFGRNNEWDKVKGKEIFRVERQGVPLVKVFELN